MMFCLTCGSQLTPGARFCASCGTPVAEGAGAPPTLGVPRHGTPPSAPPAFLTGDWVGAVLATLVGVGSMLGVALLAGVVRYSENSAEIETKTVFGEAFQLTAMAAGGSIGQDDVSLTFRPLGLTLLGYTLIAFFFLRRLRRAGPPTAAGAGLQAGRLASVHFGALILVAALSRIEGDGQPRADLFPTVFWGTVTLAIALFVAWLIGLPGRLPGRAEYYRGLLVGPVKSILFLIVISCAAALGFVLLLVMTESTDSTGPLASVLLQSGVGSGPLDEVWRPLVFAVLLYLPTIAGWSLLLGTGVPSETGGPGRDESVSILDLTDGNDLLWLWPLAAIALLVATGYYSARKSPLAANGRPVGWWLTAVLPVALLVLALTASISLDGPDIESSLGFDLVFVILLGAVYGILVGMLGSVLVQRRSSPVGGYPAAAPPGYPPPGFPPGPPTRMGPPAPRSD